MEEKSSYDGRSSLSGASLRHSASLICGVSEDSLVCVSVSIEALSVGVAEESLV